jgi:diguanylate cyclase (GGDEF)-like protein
LRAFAEICRNSVRSADAVSRFGGEEFLVLLPATDAEHATILANRIRANTELATVHSEGVSFKMTVSIGIAQFESGSDPFEQIVARADTALYRAKQQGRNRVEIERKDVGASQPSS